MSSIPFIPCCRPLLVGSFPHDRHETAVELILAHTPEYPVWPQLPVHAREGMMVQYIQGLPGLTLADEKVRVDVTQPDYDQAQLAFFETLLAEDPQAFAQDATDVAGLFALEAALKAGTSAPLAVKGQITGPFTQGVAVKDMEGKAVYFDPGQREAVVGLLAARAAWQVRYLKDALDLPVILFIDEPGLAGFGSSAFIGVGRDEVVESLSTVIQAVHRNGAIAGIHVCGNTDWGLVMDSGADMINFDASGYFDRLLLYGEELKAFVGRGGCLAWGMVPTANADEVAAAEVDGMAAAFESHLAALEKLGLDRAQLLAQSVITPACGLGSRTRDEAVRVMELTRDLSARIRAGLPAELKGL